MDRTQKLLHAKKYREKHHNEILERERIRRIKNRDEIRRKDRERYKKRRSMIKKQYLEVKIKILTYYGGGILKCVCCGEDNYIFLGLDHIKNNGSEDRKTNGAGSKFYKSLIRLKFPPGLQTMCFNCNWGKRLNSGVCPHQSNGGMLG